MSEEQFQYFFGDDAAQWAVFRQSDPSYYDGICAFIKSLASFGITTSRLTVADGAIFKHHGIRKAIETFICSFPLRPLPVDRITIVRQISPDASRRDWETIQAECDAQRDAMERFANAYNIGISLHLYIHAFDASIASKICTLVEAGIIENLPFIYGFPALPPDAATALRSELAKFLDDPHSRLPGVSFAGFPFCFAPSEKFKALFRYSLNDLKGLIGPQRQTIVKITGQRHNYLPACSTCRCKAACYGLTDIGKHADYAPVVKAQTEDTVAFVGGSLLKSELIADTGIVYTAPAEQGDLLAAILAGFRNILIIDGYFYSKFPCTTFEVMLALEQGLNVFGASSIGALRAVELDRYGMTGIGYVYEYLRRQAIKPYHIVAQTYAEDDTAITPPLVEIIYFLECASRENILNPNDAARCLTLAETISFPLLSFEFFFSRLKETDTLETPALQQLEDYFRQKGRDHFRIKRDDALQLLRSFRSIIAGRSQSYVWEQFVHARDTYLNKLYAKYHGDPDLLLPDNWRQFRESTTPQRDRRALSAQETCRLAEEFFRDLDVVVADTTGFDPPAGSFIINIFFVPFYFLSYPLSSSTGNGDVFEEALASAYMELVERIPTYNFKLNGFVLDELPQKPLGNDQVPQYYNFAAVSLIKDKVVQDHGYVGGTDILTGETCYLPRFAVMSVFTGTDGNASGNSLPEAILYGLYELVERDTNQLYQVDPVCRERINEMRLDPSALTDELNQKLIARLEDKGYRLALFQMPNTFGLPCLRCRLFDLNRNIECHGSTAVRADFHAAVNATLHEAYMQHISYFTGLRDDYRSFQPRKEARIAYQTAKATLFDVPPRYLPVTTDTPAFASITEELDYVVDHLRSAGIRRIIVANSSPRERYGVKSVKVIVPGMELWFVPEYQPSRFVHQRALNTRAVLEKQLHNKL